MKIRIKLLAIIAGVIAVLGVNEFIIRNNYPGAYLLWTISVILLVVSIFLGIIFPELFTIELGF